MCEANAAANSPDLVMAKQLLDELNLCGFQFQRTALGEDAPLIGHPVADCWADLIHMEGFSHDCFALPKRISALIAPSDSLLEHQTNGSALTVLNEVLAGLRPIPTGRVPWLACPEVPSVNVTRPTFSGAHMSMVPRSRRTAPAHTPGHRPGADSNPTVDSRLTAGPSKPSNMGA